MSAALQALRLLDAAFALAISVGVNVERYRQLKEQNNGEPLTAEQLDDLESEARESASRL